ncbi:MAG: bifunctional diaminohydroxyphosphoribosylaminopyrimidine deaminase/5-amino-6-(5-phosphoribosylamino)uracil reductase RibD [bacterium]
MVIIILIMLDRSLDERFMQEALSLATKGWARTGINPLVGAVVVKNNQIVGRGFHRRIGEAHAEVIALIEAGSKAYGSTLYVNLEPCSCTGRTPPCVEAILKAGIKRVVIGMYDPNPAVNKQGEKFLLEHNINVSVGILEKQAQELNRFYRKYITTKIPYVIVKLAVSHDGRISGFPQKYITNEKSLRFVHSLRGQVDAILVGINTVLKDDPYLTDRFVGRHNPARIVIDPHLKIPMTANFLKDDARRIIITSEKENFKKVRCLKDGGIEMVFLSGDYYPIKNLFEIIGQMDISSVMIEGGGILFSQLLSKKFYDELYIFVAPQSVNAGIDFLQENNIELAQFQAVDLGEDRLYVHRNN